MVSTKKPDTKAGEKAIINKILKSPLTLCIQKIVKDVVGTVSTAGQLDDDSK